MNINEKTRKALLRFQQNEITESLLYTQLAAIEKDPSNKEVLLQIANDEKGHYTILKKYTGQEISPNKLRVTKYYWLARILGITFAIKLMEGSEESAKNDYASYDEYPDLQQIARDEDEHEQRLIALINAGVFAALPAPNSTNIRPAPIEARNASAASRSRSSSVLVG